MDDIFCRIRHRRPGRESLKDFCPGFLRDKLTAISRRIGKETFTYPIVFLSEDPEGLLLKSESTTGILNLSRETHIYNRFGKNPLLKKTEIC